MTNWGPWARTQINVVFEVGFTFAIWAPDEPGADPCPHNLTWSCSGYEGGGWEFVGVVGGNYRFHRWIGPFVAPDDDDLIDIPPDGGIHRWEVKVRIDSLNLICRTGESPIGWPNKTGVTHSKEMLGQDNWALSSPCNQTITFDTLNHTEAYLCGILPQDYGLSFNVPAYHGTSAVPEVDGLRIEDIHFHETPINANKLDEYVPAFAFPSGVDLHMIGEADTIRFTVDEEMASGIFAWACGMEAPLQASFTGLSITDMDGTLMGDLEVWIPAIRELDEDGHDAGPTKHTVDEWRALHLVQSTGIYTWEDDDPDMLPAMHALIDKESGQAHGLEGMGAGHPGVPA